jgi:N-acetylmuramate 1-kinase
LLEHLGSGGLLDEDGAPVRARYEAAAELLAEIHGRRWPAELQLAPGLVHRFPPYDRGAMMIEAELAVDWYLPWTTGGPLATADRRSFVSAWNIAIDRLEHAERSLVLRDFHSPNIIWRPEKAGEDRLGLLDFQDALVGPSAYDVASLAQDARVTISEDLEQAIVDAYCRARQGSGGLDRTAFEEAYAIMVAQRSSKILGIFVRLHQRDGKPQYLKHLPRIRAYAARALRHPALAPVRDFYIRHGLIDEGTA